jgi:hypothetical protein
MLRLLHLSSDYSPSYRLPSLVRSIMLPITLKPIQPLKPIRLLKRPIRKWVNLSLHVLEGHVTVMISLSPSMAAIHPVTTEVYPLALRVLRPFTTNANTGNCYEITTYLEDLRQMGLTDHDLDALDPLLQAILRTNNKSGAAEKIRAVLQRIRQTPTGTGLFVQGKRVINLLNVSQDDDHGDTADKIFILETGEERGESIVGRVQSLQNIKKCISNPTAKRLGCTPQDITLFNQIAKDAIEPHCQEMRALYGQDMTAWPSRVKTQAALQAQQRVALLTAERFNSLTEDERRARMDDLLKSKPGTLTAHRLRVVQTDCTASYAYDLVQKDLKRENPCIVADGVFLRIYLGQGPQGQEQQNQEQQNQEQHQVGYIQVKYNNGCWHYSAKKKRWETSSIHTSWNATAFMTRVFDLTETE